MLRQNFNDFFVKEGRLLTRAPCGCLALVKEKWVEEFAQRHHIDLGKEKFGSWAKETKKTFVLYIQKRLSRGQLVRACTLHR